MTLLKLPHDFMKHNMKISNFLKFFARNERLHNAPIAVSSFIK